MINILHVNSRDEFRDWLVKNHDSQKECWISSIRRKPNDNDGIFYYIDAVEEALCFGWIDSVHKNIDGKLMQRFSPRVAKSPWTELNKERFKRMEKLGKMTQAGRKALQNSKNKFTISSEFLQILDSNPKAKSEFYKFPKLYQRIRIDNIQKFLLGERKIKNHDEYCKKMIDNFLKQTTAGKMYGNWNDYGRLGE